MAIAYDRSGGGFFTASTLTFRASNAFAPDVPLFVASGDGERNCTVEAFANCDPVSTLLAAYAISCRLDPKEFGSGAEKMCERHISLGMSPGMSQFHGMRPEDFEASFTTYPAPVPQAFAQQVASFQPQQANPLMLGVAQQAGGTQPGMAVAPQPGMALAPQQPGVALAQPMPTSHVVSVQVPQGVQGGMPMQVQTPGGVMQVQVPPGVQPGMTFQVQVPGAETAVATAMASASISSDAPPVAVAIAVPVDGATPIDKSKPPGRVRAMFKRLDKDASGTLTAEELKVRHRAPAALDPAFDAPIASRCAGGLREGVWRADRGHQGVHPKGLRGHGETGREVRRAWADHRQLLAVLLARALQEL